MAPEILGEGVLIVSVQQDVDREMKEAEAAFERARRRMDRKKASMILDADLAPLQKKVDQAEKKVEEYKRRVQEDANLGLDTSKAERNLKDWERKLHQRRSARDEVNLDTEKARRQLAALQQIEDDRAREATKYQRVVEKGERRLADARVAQAKRTAKAIEESEKKASAAAIRESKKREAEGKRALASEIANEQKRVRSAVAAQAKTTAARLKEEAKARAEIEKTAAAHAKALQKDRDNVAGLLQDYAALQKRISGLRRQHNKLSGFFVPSKRASLDLDTRAAEEKASRLAQRLEAVGVDKKHLIDIEVRERNTGAIGRLVSGLSDASVRLGPFTSSVGGAIRGLTLLGPVIVSVVGALGALVGVLGSGLLGGVGALGTAVGGLIPLLAGVVFAMKPMISDFSLATKAQTKLHKAVLQYGKGSDQAKKAQQELNSTLSRMDPTAARAVKAFGRVRDSWNKVTHGVASRQFGRVIGQAVKTAEANVKSFGGQTNRTMRTVGGAITKAMKALRTPGAQKSLNTFFTNINNILPGLLDGFGNLAVAVGRVMKSFSRGSVLGGLIRDFKSWTERVKDASGNTDKLNAGVDKVVDSFRNLVSFGSALSRFLKDFFGAGVKPGNKLLKDMTDGLNNAADAMEKPGASGLDDFFKNSVDTAEQFYQTLKPFLQLFLEWSTIMRPVATNLLAIIEPVADLTRKIMQMKGVRGIIVGIFTALLAKRALGGIRNLAGEVKLLGRNLRGLKVPRSFSALFGRGKTKGGATTPAGGATTSKGGKTVVTGGGKTTVVDHAAREEGAVRIIGPLPLPVEVIGVLHGGGGHGGGGAPGGGKGGGGGPIILPSGVDPKEVPKQRGIFARFFGKVFGGIKKIPGIGKLSTAIAAGLTVGRGFAGKLLSPFTKIFTATFGRLGPILRPILGRVLGRGLFAGIGKLLGKFVPVLGWGWLIHDMLPDGPRKFIDKILGDGLKGIGKVFKDNFEASLKTAGDIWGGVKSGATHAFDFIKGAAGKTFGVLKTIFTAPIKLHLMLADKAVGAAKSAVGFIGRQAGRGFKIALGLKDSAKSAASKVFSFIAGRASKGAKFILGLADRLMGAARSVMNSVAGIARKGAKFALGLLDKLRGPAHAVMGAVSSAAHTGAKFALGLLDKLSHAAATIFAKIRSAAAAGASFTIRIGATLVGAAAKLGSKAFNAAKSIIPAQGHAPNFGSTMGHLPAFAQGGNARSQTTMQDRLHDNKRALKVLNALEAGARTRPLPAAQTPTGRVQGQTVSRPTYLVGEENRKEYVVSTNPAYKGRNRKIVAMAAKDLGMGVIAAAQGVGTFGSGGDAGYYANPTVANLSSKNPYHFSSKRSKKRKIAERKRARKGLSPAAINNPWGKHIKGLLDQQSDWEREASIRENAVKEPEDYINETKDPTTGITTYTLDQAAIDEYKREIQFVADAYKTLTQITAEIVQSIPKAIQSMKDEIKARNYNISTLTHEINREEARLRTKGTSASAEATRNSARNRLKKLRPALSQEKKLKGIAIGLRDEFSGETRKEAGFDYREFTATYAGLIAELGDGQGSIAADAAAQLADAQSGGGAGGGGGGGDTPLSYGAQQLISDTEKMNLLREYGGNAYTTSPSTTSGMSPGGGGYQGNPAGISDPSRGGGNTYGTVPTDSGSGATTLRSMAATGTASSGSTYAASSTSGGGTTGATDASKTITITNNYTTAPEDPHLWSQGMAFEINTAL